MTKMLQLQNLTDLCIICPFRILSPLIMNEYAWSRDKTVLYGSIWLSIAGVIAVVCFLAIASLSKR